MNLEILSFDEALRYFPNKNSYGIRIFSSSDCNLFKKNLIGSPNWIDKKNYIFDDVWLKGHDAFDYSNFRGAEKLFLKENFFGGVHGRKIIFDENIARKIQEDYERVCENVENVMIHCMKGQNRSPAVGIAMNEIYGWGYGNLKKEFPFYRKFVYDKMIDVAKKR